MPVGRPTRYRKEYDALVRKLCLLGATDREMADIIEVAESTFNKWKLVHKSFSESLKEGRAIADAEVASRLYERAMGYEHEEEKIFQYEGSPVVVQTINRYPPDTSAAALWLKTRQPDKWREVQQVDHNITMKDLTDQELVEYIRVTSSEIDTTG